MIIINCFNPKNPGQNSFSVLTREEIENLPNISGSSAFIVIFKCIKFQISKRGTQTFGFAGCNWINRSNTWSRRSSGGIKDEISVKELWARIIAVTLYVLSPLLLLFLLLLLI